MGLGVGEAGALGRQLGAVGGHGDAAALQVSGVGLIRGLEFERCVRGFQLAHAVRQVELAGGACLDADRLAAQPLDAGDAAGFGHHQTLAVIEDDRRKAETVAPCRIAAEGVSGVAGQQIHLAAGQGCKAFTGVEIAKFNLVRITENRCCGRTADVHIQPPVAAVAGDAAEARQRPLDAADQIATALDQGHLLALQSALIAGATSHHRCRDQGEGQPPPQVQHHRSSCAWRSLSLVWLRSCSAAAWAAPWTPSLATLASVLNFGLVIACSHRPQRASGRTVGGLVVADALSRGTGFDAPVPRHAGGD